MSKTAILGACTAYGIARKYGYTGTEEEWNALQNSLKNEAATYANSARSSASAALTSEQKAAASEANAKAYMDSAEESKNAAFSATPEGYEANMQKLLDMDIQTATGEYLTLYGTKSGGIKLNSIKGKSVQDGEPTPDAPIDIQSVGDGGSVKVTTHGKNLIPYPYKETTQTVNGITVADNGDGTLTLNGTSTKSGNVFRPISSEFSNIYKSGKYVLSGIPSGASSTTYGMWLGIYDLEGNNIKAYQCYNNIIFEVNFDFKIQLNIAIKAADVTLNDVIFKPMIEVGDTATDYEPYRSTEITIPLSEPLRSIGDVKDEIVMKDGKWGVLRKTGKYVLDGTENLILDETNISDYGISIRLRSYSNVLIGILPVNIQTRDFVTNRLRSIDLDSIPYYDSSSTVDKGSGVYRTGAHIWFSFGATDIVSMGISKDIDSIKTWLSNNNIEIIYPLEEPTFEPFSDQTPFYGLSSFEGVTNITTDQTIEPTLEIEYGKSMVGAYTLENHNTSKKNEALLTDLQTAYLTTLAQEV